MIFTKGQPDAENGIFYRLVSAEGWELVVYPVMFGYRIRLGRTGELTYHTDWCAGADLEFAGLLLEIAESILTLNRPQDLPPTSERKPAYLDLNFMQRLLNFGPVVGRKHYSNEFKDFAKLKWIYHANALSLLADPDTDQP